MRSSVLSVPPAGVLAAPYEPSSHSELNVTATRTEALGCESFSTKTVQVPALGLKAVESQGTAGPTTFSPA